MLIFIVLSALFASASVPHERELKNTVSAYWNLMGKGEKAAALKFVLESSQNDFINRDEPKIRAWRYVSANSINPQEAEVTVEIEAIFKGAPISAGFQTIQRRETWVWNKKAWKLRVEKPSVAAIAPFFTGEKAKEPLPSVLQISPSILRIQFFSKVQDGRIRILNGTEAAADLVSAKVDEGRFDIVKRPDHVQPGQSGELVLHYKGTENDKNLESQITVVLKQGDQEKLFQIPIVYNYLSDGARGLLGLTEEQAKELKRGDKVAPVFKQPTPPGAPPQVPGQR